MDSRQQFKKQVISRWTGKHIQHPDDVSMEVAKQLEIPFHSTGNREIRAKDAGKIGGVIGGNMVKEMVRMAQKELSKDSR